MREKIDPNWYMAYLGKPWEGVPHPPKSYTCGELLRAVHRDLFGIDSMPIPVPDANILRACIDNMEPELYGLVPLKEGENPREFDTVFLSRNKYDDHCGIACQTVEGLLILHCENIAGVHMSSLGELKASGYRQFNWYRHRDMDALLAARR